jgi:hypothetical protein
MITRLILVLLLAFIQSVYTLTADSIPLKFNNIQLHYGFIIPHSEAIKDVAYTNPAGIEFTHGNLHTSFNDWKVFNSYWVSGLKVRYFNFQYPDVLGSVYELSVFAGPLVWHGKNHQFIISGGGGLSYHTEIYDPAENPLNLYFSTRLSFPVYVEARFKYRLGERTFITLAGSYNHISNGGIKQPNKGMNFPTFSIGLERFNAKVPVLENSYKLIPSEKRNLSIVLQTLASYKVMDSTAYYPEEGFIVYGFDARVSKPLGSIYSLNAGAEFIIDGYLKEQSRREETDTDHKRLALTIGQDFTFGRILFLQHLGIYIYSPYEPPYNFYQKYEIAYKTKGRMIYGVFLKAHLYIAELMGFTVGYQLIR